MSNPSGFTHYAYHVQSVPVTAADEDQNDIYMPRLDQINVPIMAPETSTDRVTKHKRQRNTAGVKKRVRTEFTPSQLIALNREFTADIYISKVRKIELAYELHLTEHQVKLWFQNRRAAMKKRSSRTVQQTNSKMIQETNSRMIQETNNRMIQETNSRRFQQTSICDSESTNFSNNGGKLNVDGNGHEYLANGFNSNSCGPCFNSNFEGDLDNSFNKFFDTYLGNNFDSNCYNNLDGCYPVNSSSNSLCYNVQPDQSTVNKSCNDSYPMNENVDNFYGVGPLPCGENQDFQPSVDTVFNFGNDLFDLW